MEDETPKEFDELLKEEFEIDNEFKGQDIDAKEEDKKSHIVNTSFYENDEYIFEQVYSPKDNGTIQFASFNKKTKEVLYKSNLVQNGVRIKPLIFDIVKNEVILLPASAVFYSSEKELVENLEKFISKYLDLPHPFYYKLVIHYILLTWVYDKLSVVPYLRALGDYGSGKTRFAQVVGSLCYKPLFLSGATSDAFLFRMIELFKGTMVINELERVNTDLKSQITVILNCGYEKGLPVGRVEGDKKKEPKAFDVFSPKLITTRLKFRDLALESRIISIPMKPTKRKDIQSMVDNDFWDEARNLRNQLLTYRFNQLCKSTNSSMPQELLLVEPRLRQTLLPLFSVIQEESIKKEFVKYALEFQEQIYSDRGMEIEALVAEKLISLFDENDKVSVDDLAKSVNEVLPEKEKVTNKLIGSKVRNFGFKTQRRGGIYEIIYNTSTYEYLKDRYGFPTTSANISLQSPQGPSREVRAKQGLGDIRDLFTDTDEGTL